MNNVIQTLNKIREPCHPKSEQNLPKNTGDSVTMKLSQGYRDCKIWKIVLESPRVKATVKLCHGLPDKLDHVQTIPIFHKLLLYHHGIIHDTSDDIGHGINHNIKTKSNVETKLTREVNTLITLRLTG